MPSTAILDAMGGISRIHSVKEVMSGLGSPTYVVQMRTRGSSKARLTRASGPSGWSSRVGLSEGALSGADGSGAPFGGSGAKVTPWALSEVSEKKTGVLS